MKGLFSLILGAAILLFGAVGFVYSGFYNASALSEHSTLTAWLLSTTSRKSIERHARRISVPDLDNKKLLLAGANDYQAMCIACHGGPGIRPEAVGKGLNPQPTDLADAARHMTVAELFWVTKNGIRMTGMPAWGASHGDSEIWPVVAFLTALPEMQADEYQSLLKNASGMGHHALDANRRDQNDIKETTVAEHSHSGDQTGAVEPMQSGQGHGAEHTHERGQDHSNDLGAGPDEEPAHEEVTEEEEHHEHEH